MNSILSKIGGARLGAAICLAVVAFGVAGCDGSDAASTNTAPPVPQAVRVTTVTAASERVTHRFSGRIEAVQTVDLSFQVGGRLTELPPKEGHMVKKGSLLAKLDTADYERAVREAKVNLKLAQQQYDRADALREKGVVAEKTLDQAKANLDLAKVALDNAEQNLAYATLRAPFDAVVTQRLVENFTNVAVGTKVIRLQDVSEIQIDFDAPEALVATTGLADIVGVTAEFAAAPGKRFPLEYRENASEPDPVTQTYRMTFATPRVEGIRILPGMTASVFAELKKPGSVSVNVPVSAVAAGADGSFHAWVYDAEKGVVAKRPVTIGTPGKEAVPVLSGLRSGDRIVTAGVQNLVEGMAVRPTEAF